MTIFFYYLFGVLHHFQHCTGQITMSSFVGRGNQYIQLVKVLYCKLLTNGKQLPAFPLEVRPGTEPRSQRWRLECYHSATMAPSVTKKAVCWYHWNWCVIIWKAVSGVLVLLLDLYLVVSIDNLKESQLTLTMCLCE